MSRSGGNAIRRIESDSILLDSDYIAHKESHEVLDRDLARLEKLEAQSYFPHRNHSRLDQRHTFLGLSAQLNANPILKRHSLDGYTGTHGGTHVNRLVTDSVLGDSLRYSEYGNDLRHHNKLHEDLSYTDYINYSNLGTAGSPKVASPPLSEKKKSHTGRAYLRNTLSLFSCHAGEPHKPRKAHRGLFHFRTTSSVESTPNNSSLGSPPKTQDSPAVGSPPKGSPPKSSSLEGPNGHKALHPSHFGALLKRATHRRHSHHHTTTGYSTLPLLSMLNAAEQQARDIVNQAQKYRADIGAAMLATVAAEEANLRLKEESSLDLKSKALQLEVEELNSQSLDDEDISHRCWGDSGQSGVRFQEVIQFTIDAVVSVGILIDPTIKRCLAGESPEKADRVGRN